MLLLLWKKLYCFFVVFDVEQTSYLSCEGKAINDEIFVQTCCKSTQFNPTNCWLQHECSRRARSFVIFCQQRPDSCTILHCKTSTNVCGISSSMEWNIEGSWRWNNAYYTFYIRFDLDYQVLVIMVIISGYSWSSGKSNRCNIFIILRIWWDFCCRWSRIWWFGEEKYQRNKQWKISKVWANMISLALVGVSYGINQCYYVVLSSFTRNTMFFACDTCLDAVVTWVFAWTLCLWKQWSELDQNENFVLSGLNYVFEQHLVSKEFDLRVTPLRKRYEFCSTPTICKESLFSPTRTHPNLKISSGIS